MSHITKFRRDPMTIFVFGVMVVGMIAGGALASAATLELANRHHAIHCVL